MPRGNPKYAKDVAPKSAKVATQPPKSFFENSPALDRMEPRTTTEWSGGRYASTTGSVHHGAFNALVTSLHYKLNESEVQKVGGASGIRDAHGLLDKAHTFLGLHHTYHLQGHYDLAAGALAKAAKAAKDATTRGGKAFGQSFVEHSTGRQMSVSDIHASLDHIAAHYASTMADGQVNMGEAGRIAKEKRFDSTREEARAEVRANKNKNVTAGVSAPRSQDINLTGAGRPVNLPSPAAKPTSSKIFDRIGEQQPRLQAQGPQRDPNYRTMSRKEHVVKAYQDVMEHGRMHPDQVKALLPAERNRIFEMAKGQRGQAEDGLREVRARTQFSSPQTKAWRGDEEEEHL